MVTRSKKGYPLPEHYFKVWVSYRLLTLRFFLLARLENSAAGIARI
jgi:hypothetical protein